MPFIRCVTSSAALTLGLLALSSAPISAQADAPDVRYLPPAIVLKEKPSGPADLPDAIRGLPLSLDGISTMCVEGRGMIYIPVLMSEPELPIDLGALTIDPMDWNEQRVASRELGRRSLYFIEPGRTMLYGVMIDPAEALDRNGIGVGLVVLKRVDEEMYDVLIQSNKREVLAAARGKLRVLDPTIGQGTLVAIVDQAPIREIYGARWDIDPNESCYPMMSTEP